MKVNTLVILPIMKHWCTKKIFISDISTENDKDKPSANDSDETSNNDSEKESDNDSVKASENDKSSSPVQIEI